MTTPEAGATQAGHPGPAVRVGLVVPSATPPGWIAAAIENLQTADADIVGAIVLPPDPGEPGRVLVRAWQSLDRRLTRPRPDPDAPRALADLPRRLPLLAMGGDGPWPPLQAVAPQVVFCLGVRPPSPSLELPLGVWCLHPEQAGELGFAATVGDLGAVEVALHRLDGDSPPRRRSWVRVHRQSPALTRARVLWKAARLPARVLGDLRAGRPATTAGPRDADGSPPPSHPAVVPAAARLLDRAVRTGSRRLLTRNDWFVACATDVEEPVPADLETLTPMAAPRDRFWADPFPVVDDERALVFVEEWPYALGRGVLAVLEVARDGAWQRLGTALECPYHLSHPFVFRWQDTWYLVPETSANGTLELYRGVDFPLGWELEAVWMQDVRVADATLHEHEGRWWMFASVADGDAGLHEELHLFYADTPLGPWTPHAANPVVCDPRGARPAGALFFWRGRLCRPAQDCGVRYGRAIVIHQVDELSPAGYAERAIARLEPPAMAGANRMHTLNTAGWLTVVDGHRDRWR